MTFLTALAAGCADHTMPVAQLPEIDTNNPLLAEWNTPHETPPFDRIRVSDYEPAFDAAIAVSRAEIDAIVNNPAKPTFNNTIVALDRQGRLLSRVEGIFFNLLEADATPEMQQVAENVQPKLTALSNDISLNPQLFERVKAVYEHPGWFLSKEDKKCTAPQKLDTFGVFFMKYNYEIRLKAVKLVLEGGLSVREAGCHLGCGRSQVHLWVTLFERHGLTGLKLRHGSYSAEFKLSVLKHMHQNHLSLLETAVHFGIPGPFVIRQWERLYQNQGAEGLRRKPQRRRPAMSKSKTKKVKLKTTPHEELLKELEYLRAENAYLKKLQALVEERIVRESGKEPKPSKD